MLKILSMLLIICFSFSGCVTTSTSFYSEKEAAVQSRGLIHAVVLKDGSKIVFNDEGGRYSTTGADSSGSSITGITTDGSAAQIASQDVLEVEMQLHRFDAPRTMAVTSLTAIVTGLCLFFVAMSDM